MRLPVLRSTRRPSLSRDQLEGVVVDYLQVSRRQIGTGKPSCDTQMSPSLLARLLWNH